MERRGSPLLPKNQRQQPQQAPLLPPQEEAVGRAAATSSEAPATSVAGPSTMGRTEPQKPSAAKASAVQPLETMDLRDRLLAGIVEDSSSERDDDSAEVIIEPDGRIKVHPRQKPNYLRNGGPLEPPSFGAGLRADRGSLDRDTQTAEYLLLLELLKSQRQDKGAHAGSARAGSARAGSARAGGLNSLLQEEIRKLVIEEAASRGGSLPAFAELKSGSRSDPDTSSTEGQQYSDARMLASPTGYFLAFIVGFGGILIIAMLCCIIRAAYVRQQKARLKKILAEKLQGTEEAEALGLTKPTFYEVLERQPSGEAPSKDPTKDPDWVDVRVEQQAPPEENQMITVARQDTLSKAGLSAEATEEEQASQQLPTKSKKKQKKKSAEGGLWAEDESGKEREKSRKKPSRGSDDERGDAREEKKKKPSRRGKEFKKALSGRKALRPAS